MPCELCKRWQRQKAIRTASRFLLFSLFTSLAIALAAYYLKT